MPRISFYRQENAVIRPPFEKKWLTVPVNIFEDESISWEAKGFLVYALGKSDNHLIKIKDIKKKSTLSSDVFTIVKELLYAGYIKRKPKYRRSYDRSILKNGFEFHVYDVKQPISPQEKKELDEEFNEKAV